MKRYKFLIVLVGFLASNNEAAPQGGKKGYAGPKTLLIYYGWPSCINGANNIDGPNGINAAATEFSKYTYVVLGGGLEDPKHEDHLKSKAIIGGVINTTFFGYVPLGNRKGMDKCLDMKEIQTRLKAWAAMGVKGVLLDEFGFDYEVSRIRQNEAVDIAHKLRLRVIANAWDPDHVFLPDPKGVKPSLKNDGDIYLWESYRFNEGSAVEQGVWMAKAAKIEKGRMQLPLSVFSVSTNNTQPDDAKERFAHQWFSAAIDGHIATGWGHPTFGGNSKATLVNVPLTKKNEPFNLGNVDLSVPLAVAGTTLSRPTSLGVIRVDASDLSWAFVPNKK